MSVSVSLDSTEMIFTVFRIYCSLNKKSKSTLVEFFYLLLKHFANPYCYLDMIPRFGQITFEIGCEFQTNTQGHETSTKSSNYAMSIGSSLKIQAKF